MDLDAQLFVLLHEALKDGPVGALLAGITWLGNGWVQAALCVPLLWRLSPVTFRRHMAAIVLTAAIGGAAVAGLKVVIGRERPARQFPVAGVDPTEPAGYPGDYSFPSGHAQTAFSTATYLSFLLPAAAPPLLAAAALVALSRISLGVHFPADVVAGALLGLLMGTAGFQLNRQRLLWGGSARSGDRRP